MSGNCRQLWEDIYGFEVLPTTANTLALAIAAGANFAADANSHGLTGNWTDANVFNLLPVDAYPNFKAPRSVVEKQLATGKSIDNVVSKTPVASKPEPITIPVIFNAHNLAAFIRLLMQSGVSYAQGVINTALEVMTAIPYVEACPIHFGNAVRVRQDGGDGDTVDELLQGIIVKRILIKGEEGGVIEGEIDVLPGKWDQVDLTSNQVTAIQSFDSLAPLKFEDLTCKIQNKADGTAMDTVNIPSFEITLENNVQAQYYNENYAKGMVLGRLKVTGNIVIPWNDLSAQGKDAQITDYLDNTDKVFTFCWGDTTVNPVAGSPNYGVDVATGKNSLTNNFFALHVNAKISDYDNTDIDENPMVPVDFTMVEDSAATIGTLKILAGYAHATNKWGTWE